MEYKEIIKLFSPSPEWFTYRGTGAVWEEIKTVFENSDGFVKDKNAFKTILYDFFKKATGLELEQGKIVYIKKYDPGHGLSSGVVSFTWWDMVGIPILCSRFEENKAPFSSEKIFLDKMRSIISNMIDKEKEKNDKENYDRT